MTSKNRLISFWHPNDTPGILRVNQGSQKVHTIVNAHILSLTVTTLFGRNAQYYPTTRDTVQYITQVLR